MHSILSKQISATNFMTMAKLHYNKPQWFATKAPYSPPGYTDPIPSSRTIYFNNGVKDALGNTVGALVDGGNPAWWSYGKHPTTGMGFLTSNANSHPGGVDLTNGIVPTNSQNYSFVINFKLDSWTYTHLCGGVGGYPSIYSGYGAPLTFSINSLSVSIDPSTYINTAGWFQMGIHRNATRSYITLNGKTAYTADPGIRGSDTFVLGAILNYQTYTSYSMMGSVGTIRYSTTCYTTAQLNQMMMQDLGISS